MTAMLHDLVAALGDRDSRRGRDQVRAARAGPNRRHARPRWTARPDEPRATDAATCRRAAHPDRLCRSRRAASPAAAAKVGQRQRSRGRRRRHGLGRRSWPPSRRLRPAARRPLRSRSRDALALAHAVAALLSPDADADGRFATAASKVVEDDQRNDSLDRAVENLVDALDRDGRGDEALVEAASGEGEVAFVAMLIARRAGIDQPAVWDHLVNAGEGGLALVARMAGFGRRAAARLIADLGSTTGGWSVEEEIARYDFARCRGSRGGARALAIAAGFRAAVRALEGHRG